MNYLQHGFVLQKVLIHACINTVPISNTNQSKNKVNKHFEKNQLGALFS